jgi:hypothetical protein
MKKTEAKKSRATVPLRSVVVDYCVKSETDRSHKVHLIHVYINTVQATYHTCVRKFCTVGSKTLFRQIKKRGGD